MLLVLKFNCYLNLITEINFYYYIILFNHFKEYHFMILYDILFHHVDFRQFYSIIVIAINFKNNYFIEN